MDCKKFTTKNKLIILKSIFMKNLQSFGVQELNANDMKTVNGGGWISRLKKVAEWIGVFDAIDDFAEGWNSVEPAC